MKLLGNWYKWTFAVLFIFSGLVAMFYGDTWGGLFFFLAGVLCIPLILKRVNEYLISKGKQPISNLIYFGIIVALMILGATLSRKPPVKKEDVSLEKYLKQQEQYKQDKLARERKYILDSIDQANEKIKQKAALMEQLKSDAFYMSHVFVKRILKAPSTAEFPVPSEASVTNVEDSVFVVKCYVDAQNSYSAMIRSYYYAKIKYLGDDQWMPLDVKLLE